MWPYYKTPAFQSLNCFDTLASSFLGGKSKVLVVYLHKVFLFFFSIGGMTSEGLFFIIIGFYEVFKKKSFKHRLCLACNTLMRTVSRKVRASVHLTWSHRNVQNVGKITTNQDFHAYKNKSFSNSCNKCRLTRLALVLYILTVYTTSHISSIFYLLLTAVKKKVSNCTQRGVFQCAGVLLVFPKQRKKERWTFFNLMWPYWKLRLQTEIIFSYLLFTHAGRTCA